MSDSRFCQDVPGTWRVALEWWLWGLAVASPSLDAGVSARRSDALWLMVGLALAVVAGVLEYVVNIGQVAVVS